MQVECDQCGRVYARVPEEFRGKRIKCKSCDARIVIPLPEDDEDDWLDAIDERDPTPTGKAAPPRRARRSDPSNSQKRSRSRSTEVTVTIELVRAFRADYRPETIELEVEQTPGQLVQTDLATLRDWLIEGRISSKTKARIIGAERDHLRRWMHVPNLEQTRKQLTELDTLRPIRDYLAKRYLMLRDLVYPVSAWMRRFAVVGLYLTICVSSFIEAFWPTRESSNMLLSLFAPIWFPIAISLPSAIYLSYLINRMRRIPGSPTIGCLPFLVFGLLHGWLIVVYIASAIIMIPWAILGAVYGALQRKAV